MERENEFDPLGVVKTLVARTKFASDGIQGVCDDIVALVEAIGQRGDEMATDDIANTPEFLRFFLDAGPVFAVELIPGIDDPIFIRTTRTLETMFGYSPGELDGQPISTLIPPDKRIPHKAHILGFLKHPEDRQMGNLGNFDIEAIDNDGRRFPIVLMWIRFFINKRAFLAGTVMRQIERRNA